MLFTIVLLFLGLILLIKGADWLVSGASSLAKKHHISDIVIGLTIVAFGTSAPELVVNVFASINDNQGIVFGNVIGSNLFNLFLVLGIAGIISPLVVRSGTVWKEIPLSLLSVAMLFLLANDQLLGSREPLMDRIDGLFLLLFFGLFLYFLFRNLKKEISSLSVVKVQASALKVWAYIIGGLVGLVIGGRLVVDQAVDIAATLGVNEKLIGLTIVAAGTSLPELATSVVATINKNNDIAIGNIIGSNIFNIFFILAMSSIVRPVTYDIKFNMELAILATGTLFLFLAMFSGKKYRLDRWEAMILVAIYLGYMSFVIFKALQV